MKVSTFLGFTQEKIEFVLNGRDLSNRGKELLLFFDLLPLGHFISFPASRLAIFSISWINRLFDESTTSTFTLDIIPSPQE